MFLNELSAFSPIKMILHSTQPSSKNDSHLSAIACEPLGCDLAFDGRGSAPLLLRSCCLIMMALMTGCNFIPDIKRKPQYHNPFPQISKVAILPFRNQSQEPTLSGARVSMAYYNELQAIRGFEVIPYGVVENQMAYFETQILRRPIMTTVDFQQFAKHLGVDAVLQGAITDYDAYYPPRITMKVNWYAANPGFHPIPVGYGLPWGTKKEKSIPEWIRLESERALAAEQMKTQTPEDTEREPIKAVPLKSAPTMREDADASSLPAPEARVRPSVKQRRIAASRIELPVEATGGKETDDAPQVVTVSAIEEPERMPESVVAMAVTDLGDESNIEPLNSGKPANWPDPQGFIPRQPAVETPKMQVQFEPIISHMRTYNGSDEDFTHALGEYYYFRDDARFGGWQSYLQRSEDFIRFCCHQHIVETLESRGGSLESRMILRWPVNRYER